MNGENLNESDIDNIYEDALIVFLKVIMENVNQKK